VLTFGHRQGGDVAVEASQLRLCRHLGEQLHVTVLSEQEIAVAASPAAVQVPGAEPHPENLADDSIEVFGIGREVN